MSKKYLKITTYILLAFFVFGIFAPSVAHASLAGVVGSTAVGAAMGSIVPGVGTAIGAGLGALYGLMTGEDSFVSGITIQVIGFIAASLSNIALQVTSWLMILTGNLLNVSVTLTLHIKDFVNSTQGVYLVWQTIRDVSGMFVIFMLLYASFKVILGFDTVGGVGNLIKNIVIAGILINFSFFITSLLIDASNMVSLALYNGIVSTTVATTGGGTQNIAGQTVNCPTTTTGSLDTCTVSANTLSSSDGGLSGLFLKYLSPQLIYKPNDNVASTNNNAIPLYILIQGVVGCLLMFTMSMSFLLAALAFIARLLILILLLGFSPIWFASMIFPILKDKSKDFTDTLYSQLTFMPVYLLLLYAAMTILKNSTVFTNPGAVNFSGTMASSIVPVNLIILIVNDFFILFLLNMPLIVAFSFGGTATSWLNGATERFNAANVWKQSGSFAGRNSVGRAAANLRDSAIVRKIETISPFAGRLINNNLTNVASSGFGGGKGAGYDQVRKKRIEEYKKLGEHANLNDDEKEQVEKFLRGETDELPYMMRGKREQLLKSAGKLAEADVNKDLAEEKSAKLKTEKKVEVEKITALQQRLSKTQDETAKIALAAEITASNKRIEQLSEEIVDADTTLKAHEASAKKILDEAKNLPKNEYAAKMASGGSVGKAVAREYRKEAEKKKDPNSSILEKLEKLSAQIDKDKSK